MAPDDLNTPLGLRKKTAQFRPPPMTYPIAAGVLAVFLATFAAWLFLDNDPLGGEPMVVVRSDLASAGADGAGKRHFPAGKAEKDPGHGEILAGSDPPGNASVQEPDKSQEKTKTSIQQRVGAAGKSEENPAANGEQIVTIIDGKSGARQEVKIPASADGLAPGIDPQLIEATRNGPIPRIGADGLRAAQAFAKPVPTKPNSPQISIVVTGMGISANITTEAINKLPSPITLAFAPYGSDLERVTGKARTLGHELLLQVPMEPFDYPENDPGPQTLVTSLTPEQNTDRLQWLMGRFQGYVGITNQMGTRFTATAQAFSTILREISKRGLIYVDDGSSPRSLAGQIAGGNNLPFAKANVILDTVPSAAEIDRALVRLEAIARENGNAVGFASALPVSIERISLWAKTAEGRGFTLTPISMAAAHSKST